MTLIDAILIATAVFVAVSAMHAIAFYIGAKRQAEAAKERQRSKVPASDATQNAKAAVESFRDKSSAVVEKMEEAQMSAYQRGQRQADRADALYERSERTQERWERILQRLESLVSQLETRSRRDE